jgi:predicted ArsR family transcriptional regulator
MADLDFTAEVTGVACLAEPVRLALYRFVSGQPGPVGRDAAAESVGVPRHTAKFHLDKLVEEGLLDVEFRRLTGRAGPGAGRPAKLYRRSDRQISVTLPDREYELAGELMATAIERSAAAGSAVVPALHEAARARGQALGDRVKADVGRRSGRAALLTATTEALAACGYEPRVEGACVTLANCPFHALAQRHAELVCGMNLALLDEMVSRSEGRLTARLEPDEGRCCVVLTAT